MKTHSPQLKRVRVGFVALTDCAPLLAAESLGLFAKHGVEVDLVREVGWATVREKILYGQLDTAHAIAGLALSMRLGLDGHTCNTIAPFVFNLHGNAITLSRDLWLRGVRDAAMLHKLIRSTQRLFTFGIVSRVSSHNFLLRRWLKSGGIDPDKDVRLVVLPPTQMIGTLTAGLIDGYCVGEPWNSVAIAQGIGWCPAISEDIVPQHPEKILLTTENFANGHPVELQALIRALNEACMFCDVPENREQIVSLLMGSGHIQADRAALRASLIGPFDMGTGVKRDAASFHIFHGKNANTPSTDKARWIVNEFVEQGLIPQWHLGFALKTAEACWREDLFLQAMESTRTGTRPRGNINPTKTATRRPIIMNNNTNNITRREALRKTVKTIGATALFTGLPKGWIGSVYADDSPETTNMKFGMIALTDCSSIVIAHEKGLFKKYGIASTVLKGASWAAIRDSLSNGDLQATHMLIGMPIASTMGLAGAPKKPMIIPWLINRNGQAISLANKYKGKVKDDPKALKPFADEAKKAGNPLTFAMTFPPGTHAMWMRYYLAAGGIHPGDAQGAGADISLITIPPAQMVSNMKIGKMDGFCVGEPWNARTIADDIGFTSITTQHMWKNHPEKVCAFTAEFADKNPKTVKAVLKALHESSVWLDKMENRPEQAKIVSAATYINCPPEVILGRLQGKYDMGDGRKFRDPDYMKFSEGNCNYPQIKYCKWWLTQLRRWGFTEGAPDYEAVTKQVMRPDIYEEAMKEIGYAHGGANNDKETFFDGPAFDPASDLDAYAKSFAINSVKG